MSDLYSIPVRTIAGDETTLAPYRGRVLLVVNVASRCGFTGQYRGLEELHRRYRERGFAVLGFPCNQFAGQEPGADADIQQFCTLKYEVSFPMFAKVEVNGPGAHPLFRHLKHARKGLLGSRAIKWNFTKFLVDRGGEVVARHGPLTAPSALANKIEHFLEAPVPA